MTLTIELPADVAANLAHLGEDEKNFLAEEAEAVAVAVYRRHTESVKLTPEEFAAVQQSLADIEAGRTYSWEECQAEWAAEREARRAKRAASNG